MKKYRVMYSLTERTNSMAPRIEEVYADGWRIDYDTALFYQRDGEGEVRVFDVPKTRVMRIQELRA
jgi:hypothetical protein